jgi:predicted nuclease with TOPRIM domain
LIADLWVEPEAANLQHIVEGRQIDRELSAMKQRMKELEVESDSLKSDYQRMLNEKNFRLTSALPELVDLPNSIVGKRPSLGTRLDLHVKWW